MIIIRFQFPGALEEEPGAKISLIRLFKHTFMTFAALHLIACRWYSLGCEPSGIKDAICDPKGWVIAGNLRLGSGGERSYGLIDDIDAEEHYIDPEVHFLATGYHVIKLPLGGQSMLFCELPPIHFVVSCMYVNSHHFFLHLPNKSVV